MAEACLDVIEKDEQLVAFQLGDETYGIEIASIQEIIRLQEVTQVPGKGDEMEGIINLRGKIVPIMNLRRRLGLPHGERTSQSRVVVVSDGECTVGMEVDSVIGVLKLMDSQVEKPSQIMNNNDMNHVRGVGKTEDALVILLNVPAVMRRDQD